LQTVCLWQIFNCDFSGRCDGPSQGELRVFNGTRMRDLALRGPSLELESMLRDTGAGEPSWIRTSDLLIKSQLLYRLSYGPTWGATSLAGRCGQGGLPDV
jgi:hypothetical protein